MLSVLAISAALAFSAQAQAPTAARVAVQRPRMPFVIDRTIDEATRIIGRFRLRIDTVRVAGVPSRALTVQRQLPDSGSLLTPETVVRLEVRMIPVPDLRGMTNGEVENALASRRLTVGQERVVQTSGEPGTAVRQSPGARTLVAPGQAVNVYYAAAPPAPPPLLMPSVIDFTLDAATGIIGQFGLRIDTLREPGPPERGTRIIKQAPEPRTPITRATRATIVVSMIAVPDFTGMTDAQAAQTLKTNLLRPGSVSSVVTNGDSGTVAQQGRSPGELVMPGTLVDLVYVVPEPQTPAPLPTQPTPAVVDTPRSTQPTSIDTARNQPTTRVDSARITIAEPAPPPRKLEATNDNSPIPIWAWIVAGLVLLLVAATIRSRLTKRERDLVDRAKMLVTVSPTSPFTPRINVHGDAQPTSIRYVVSDGQTRISVRADAPFVIKEERSHV